VHGSIHIIRVPSGHFALVTENTVPKLLGEGNLVLKQIHIVGIHVANSNLLAFEGMQSANQPYLTHGTIHLMRVAKGEVALVTDNNIPKLIGEGTLLFYINLLQEPILLTLLLSTMLEHKLSINK
jgi:hypothetical protein